MRRWILILSMLRIKGAVLLLYTALIIYSEIEIVYFYLGLSLCALQVLNLPTRTGCRNERAQEKLPVDKEDENKFRILGLLGKNSAKSLLNVVYFYNGKLFGLRASEHRNT